MDVSIFQCIRVFTNIDFKQINIWFLLESDLPKAFAIEYQIQLMNFTLNMEENRISAVT